MDRGLPYYCFQVVGLIGVLGTLENVSPGFQNIIELLHLIRQDKVGLNKLTV